MRVRSILLILWACGGVIGWLLAPALAENWPSWRGPQGTGVVAETNFPAHFDQAEHKLWSAKMLAHAGSTPVVWGERIFLTAVRPAADPNEAGTNLACCYDLNGQLLWTQELGTETRGKHRKASGCNSSPVTDGQHVFVYFKSGEFACLNFDGKIIWQTNLQQKFAADTLWWDLGTSPVLTRDHVVVAVVQSGPSYLVAFDKATGEVAWKVDRMLDAPEEANQTYSTPLVIDHGGQQILAMLGADHVTTHRAADGQEMWRHGGMNPEHNGYFRSIASAVYSDGVIVAPYARGKTLTALDLSGKVLWHKDDLGTDVPTPAARDGELYLCTDKGTFLCFDMQSGKELWSVSTPKSKEVFSSSPTLSGDKAYLAREDGTVFVVDLSQAEHPIIANTLGEFMVATPVLTNGKLLLRTAENLYCFGSN